MKRLILETGMGNDLYGGDYTKAACRAIQDALHHSSLTLFSSLGYDHKDMLVKVTIGVQAPDLIDVERVRAELPRGTPEVQIVKGGLDAHDLENDNVSVIATAAVEAFLDINPDDWQLSGKKSPEQE